MWEIFAQSNSVSFTLPGTYSWVVPSGVASIYASLQGADGGLCNSGIYSDVLPGNGSAVSATLTVKAGSVLYINVGGQGGLPLGGYNGGGNGGKSPCSTGGGGATDIRLSASNLTTRLIVAGGGGGNYGACYSTGGNGGYPSGRSASGYPSAKICFGSINQLAGGGTHTAGGVEGNTYFSWDVVGYPGSFGYGGSGYVYDSGGGGGGYYGGGGGAYSGGGGGSSYCGPACSDVSYSEGTCCGDGSVVILFNYPNTPSGKPTAKRTTPTARPTVIPTQFVPPSRMNYYLYNGKYYSTLADVNVNNPSTTCQNTYYTLPMDWIFAPGDSDSLQVIFLNTWSTSTVVVASGDGYFSKSSYGLLNNAVSYWLHTSYSIYGNKYTCPICNCQILIMYSPYPITSKPSYSPVSYISPSILSSSATSSSSSSSSGDFLGIFFGCFCGVVFLILSFLACYFYRNKLIVDKRSQQIQVQPTTQLEDSVAVVHHDQPADTNNSYYTNGMGMQPQPVAYDLRPMDYGNVQQQQQQQQPQQAYIQTQPGYIQMQPLQVNRIQADQQYAYEYLQPQPQPQVYGRYGQPQPQPQPQPVYNYVQTQPLVYGYQLQEQSQVYTTNNSQFLQPQPQVSSYYIFFLPTYLKYI